MIQIIDGVEVKWCSRKKHLESVENFGKNKYTKDGLQVWCNSCRVEGERNNPNTKCSDCKRRRGDFKDHGGLLDEEFGKHGNQCKACHAKYNAMYPKTDRGKERINVAAEKRRALEAGLDGIDRGTLDPYEWDLMIHPQVYDDRCIYPGCNKHGKMERDHIIPHSKGGSNEAWNRQPFCKTHNGSKHNYNNIDYRPDKGLLAQAIHNLRIGQCNDRNEKKRYYEWVVAQIEIHGAQILHTLPHIFDWLEPLALAA